MMQTITLHLPQHLASTASSVANATQKSVEDILVAWIDQAATDVPVSMMSDEAILSLAKAEMSRQEQGELSQLMAGLREDELSQSEKVRLDELMAIYRQGLKRKSEALKVAVQRGLIPPLS